MGDYNSVEVISMNGVGELHFHLPKLEEILFKERERDSSEAPLLVLSVVGPPKCGKSFFANWIAKYLDRSRPGEADWVGNEEEVLRGFEFSTSLEDQSGTREGVGAGIRVLTDLPRIQCRDTYKRVLILDIDMAAPEGNVNHEYENLIRFCILVSSSVVIIEIPGQDSPCTRALEELIQAQRTPKILPKRIVLAANRGLAQNEHVILKSLHLYGKLSHLGLLFLEIPNLRTLNLGYFQGEPKFFNQASLARVVEAMAGTFDELEGLDGVSERELINSFHEGVKYASAPQLGATFSRPEAQELPATQESSPGPKATAIMPEIRQVNLEHLVDIAVKEFHKILDTNLHLFVMPKSIDKFLAIVLDHISETVGQIQILPQASFMTFNKELRNRIDAILSHLEPITLALKVGLLKIENQFDSHILFDDKDLTELISSARSLSERRFISRENVELERLFNQCWESISSVVCHRNQLIKEKEFQAYSKAISLTVTFYEDELTRLMEGMKESDNKAFKEANKVLVEECFQIFDALYNYRDHTSALKDHLTQQLTSSCCRLQSQQTFQSTCCC